MGEMIQLVMAFLGSLGFAMLFQMRGRNLWFASLGGLLAWGVYLGLGRGTSNIYLCAIGASFAMTVYSEIMARKRKTPVTVFLVASSIPLIPGGGLYRTMSAAMRYDWHGFVQEGTYTLLFAGSIAVGIMSVTVAVQLGRGFFIYRKMIRLAKNLKKER